MFAVRFLLSALFGIFAILLFVFPVQAQSDFFERSLPWPAYPRRIVSLSPATTEMLFAVGAGNQVVGVTRDCNYPPEAQRKNQLGRFGQISLESLIRLQPDLIVVTRDMRQVLSPLRRLPVPVLALDTSTVKQIGSNLQWLGQITGHRKQGEDSARLFQQRLRALRQRIPQRLAAPRVFYLLWDRPLISAGARSFIGDILNLAGARNLAPVSQAPFPHVSLEYLLRINPDFLILPESVASRIVLHQGPLQSLRAVRQKQVLSLNDDMISRPGPRVLNALEQIIEFLY